MSTARQDSTRDRIEAELVDPLKVMGLDVEAVVLSAVQSLYAWHVARLDLRALRSHGLPVWCAEHRARRSAVACGWLRVVIVDSQSSSDVAPPDRGDSHGSDRWSRAPDWRRDRA